MYVPISMPHFSHEFLVVSTEMWNLVWMNKARAVQKISCQGWTEIKQANRNYTKTYCKPRGNENMINNPVLL